MKLKRILILVVGGLIVYSFPVFAQPEEKFNPRKKEEEEIRRHIETLRMWEMTRALDLNEQQVAKIFPALNRVEKEKAELHRQISQAIKELKELLDLEKPDLAQVKARLNEIKELRELIQEKDREVEKVLEKNLSVEQQAKFVLFSVRFMQGLREKLDRARMLYRKKMLEERRERKH
ncbi:MAG: Spy/CpxP family protein refolding chaperone [Candidatus Aminicenantia bacterium]